MGLSADTRTPVVVLYRGGNGALAIARTLGRFGVPVYLVTQTGRCTVWHSRYWKKRFCWDFSAPEESSVEFLLSLSREIGGGVRPVLLTLADWLAIFIERNAERLQQGFVFPKASPPLIHRLCDKREMFLLARSHGIPTPETFYAQSVAEALEFARSVGFPVVMKGADPLLPNVSSKNILRDAAEVREAYSASPDAPNAVLQQYIPGTAADVWMCNAYFGAGSACKAAFTGRKLRQVSATGVASLGECLPNAAVQAATIRFMQAVGYEGVLDVGYRYDARDGEYKVLDVNPRVGGAFRLFRGTNGLDVVRACYLDLTGQTVPESSPDPGRKWMLEDDFFAGRAEGLGFFAWLRSIRGVRELQWFAADDPVPGFAWAWSQLRGRIVESKNRESVHRRRVEDAASDGDGSRRLVV